jgi:hypothetical protein
MEVTMSESLKAIIDRSKLPKRHVLAIGYVELVFSDAKSAAAAYAALTQNIGHVTTHDEERDEDGKVTKPSFGEVIETEDAHRTTVVLNRRSVGTVEETGEFADWRRVLVCDECRYRNIDFLNEENDDVLARWVTENAHDPDERQHFCPQCAEKLGKLEAENASA